MARTALRIINFHGIGEPERPLEPGEAPYWLSVARFNDMLDRIADHPDRDALAITFDDSNTSDLTIAAPALAKRGLTARFFVLTGRIGEPGSLDKADISALVDMGMPIGSHGIAHRDWSSLAPAELDEELKASKIVLEEACGFEIKDASIPFGRYNAAVLSRLRSAGYRCAYSSDKGSADPNAFLRARTSVRSDTTDSAVSDALSGDMPAMSRLRRAARMQLKQWV